MLAYIVVIVAIVSRDTKLGKFPTAKSTPASLPPAEGPNGKIGRPHYTLSEDFKRAPHIYADMRLNWMNSGSNYRVLYLLKSKQY